MARDTLGLFGCAGLVLTLTALLCAGPDDPAEKINSTLRVQNALGKGRESLKSGHYREAVETLEREIDFINGDLNYLNALRDSYLGLIGELSKEKNQLEEAARYRRRLKALDPGALLELKTPPDSRAPEAPVAERPVPTAEIDPFSDGNHVVVSRVRPVLEQAEAAFKDGKYDQACRLYDQVARTDESAITVARERWAYCKLYGLATRLNQGEPGARALSPQVMEQEVRRAMSMAPKLEPFGQDLLRKIQQLPAAGPEGSPDRPEEPVSGTDIRQLPRQADGWAVAETTNFRILHKDAPEVAERVGRAAETARTASSRKWFGEVPPTWTPRCDVYLHLNRDDYSRETKQDPTCPGHSTIAMEGDRIKSRRIDLHCDDLNMVIGVVPHETTHVVLAGRFGAKSLPRWADEGMAVLSEPRDRVERHLRNLPQHQRDKQLFAVADLMQFNDYPEGKYIGSFYAQSVSLVDYLCQQNGGPQGFTTFLREGMRSGGFEPALRQHYGVRGFVELQQRWQAATFSRAATLGEMNQRVAERGQ